MTRHTLLQRQVGLLKYLTDPRAFKDNPADPDLIGIDPSHMRLIGSFSFEKRMSKIRSVLPRTFEYLADDPGISLEEFAGQFPPTSATRHANCEQYLEYLRGIWRNKPPSPPFLPDLAALEAAIAKLAIAQEETTPAPPDGDAFMLRPHPAVELLHCRFDIRVLFDDSVDRAPPEEKELWLAIALPHDDGSPRIVEISRAVFKFLNRIRGWERLDHMGQENDANLIPVLRNLAKAGILEIRE